MISNGSQFSMPPDNGNCPLKNLQSVLFNIISINILGCYYYPILNEIHKWPTGMHPNFVTISPISTLSFRSQNEAHYSSSVRERDLLLYKASSNQAGFAL